MPNDFRAVGQWYVDFGQVSDEEVRRTLEQHYRRVGPQVTTRKTARVLDVTI